MREKVRDEKMFFFFEEAGGDRTYHVFCGSNKLDDTVVKLGSLPPIGGLIGETIEIEELGDFVTEVTHAAFPSGPTFDEGHIRVDVRPTTATTGDDGVGDHWYFWFTRLDRSVGCDDQCKWDLGFLQ
jgi:hypothetical protein